MENETPLIWTAKGNLPIDSLRYETAWDVQIPNYIKFVERYFQGDELVKESAHVYSFAGVTGEASVANLGG